jgi:hypothetical protein
MFVCLHHLYWCYDVRSINILVLPAQVALISDGSHLMMIHVQLGLPSRLVDRGAGGSYFLLANTPGSTHADWLKLVL